MNTDSDEDIPDEYKDPISLSIIEEPVVLCATGQVYCYKTLREWFKTGTRVCPRTNIEILDVQVTKIPWLKQKIHDWRKHNGMDIPEEDSIDGLQEIHPNLPSWIRDIRSDSGQKRTQAVTDLNQLMRDWEAAPSDTAESAKQQRMVREVVLDDMLWLLRYGDPFLQGVATSILAYCSTPDEVQWLAPTAAISAVMLCLSPSSYTSQAATRLLYNIARAGDVARLTIKLAGGVQSLLKIITTDRAEYGYSRDRAAATLAILAKDPEVKSYLRRHAIGPLKTMLLCHSDDRWEKRDAATALLALQVTQEDLGSDLTQQQLFDFFWCSRAWLEGRCAMPGEGYTQEETGARSDLDFWQANAHELMEQLLAGDLVLMVPDVEDPGAAEDDQNVAAAAVDVAVHNA